MEKQEIQAFNTRLSQWISSQGFWFQLRYALISSGSFAAVAYHMLQLLLRGALFVMLIAGGFGYYFYKRTDKKVFSDELTVAARNALGAKDAQIDGFRKSQGELRINRFGAEGTADSFFETLDAEAIRCRMGLTDGLMGHWDAGAINAHSCLIEVKAGADDAESAARAANALFRKYQNFSFSSIEVADATLTWGYSERTRGRIEKSHMLAQRSENGWRLQFRGGQFSQNWLHHLDIEDLLVSIDRNGLTIEKGEFHRDAGRVSLLNVGVTGSERPQVHGTVKIKSIPLDAILPPISSGFIEGSISADLTLSGSTNTTEGIGFQGQALFDGTDVLTLRERIHLLRALSVVDVFNSYRKVDFREGSFTIRTSNGVLDITDVDLKAKGLFTMQGRLQVRRMTNQEINAELQRGGSAGGSQPFDRQQGADAKDQTPGQSQEFALRKAAKDKPKDHPSGDSANPAATSLFDRMAQMNLNRMVEQQEYNRLSRQLRFDGGFRVTIPPDSFERAQQLREDNPVDPATGRIPLTVPIEGTLYDITLKQAEEIYQKGKRQE